MSNIWMLATVFNREDNLPGFFGRVKNQTVPVGLVLVDHGTNPISRDGLPSFVTVVRSSPDKWWTGAMNDGLRYIREVQGLADEDYVIFQNEDVGFNETLVEDLISASREYNGAVVGGVTVSSDNGLIMDADNHHSILHAKHICPHRGMPADALGLNPIDCDILKGRGVVYPGEVVNKIGYLYEKLDRRSDPEYAYRAKKHGFRVLIDPRVTVCSSVDPRTQLDGKVTLRHVWRHLFSPRSYANIKDAFFYFFRCFDPFRATYCFFYHCAFNSAYAFYRYFRRALPQKNVAARS